MTRVFVLTVMLVSVLVAEAAGKAAKKCPSMKRKLIQGIKKYETQCPGIVHVTTIKQLFDYFCIFNLPPAVERN